MNLNTSLSSHLCVCVKGKGREREVGGKGW